MLSQIFTLLGAATSGACVVAKTPELLMVGRVLVGVNTGIYSPCTQLTIYVPLDTR